MTAFVSPAFERKIISALRRGEAVGRQIGRGRDVPHKFRDVQAGQRFDEQLDAAGVRGKFFAGDLPVVGAVFPQNEIVFAAHLDFRDRRGQFEQPRIAEIIHRAAPRRQRLAGGRDDGVPAFALRINLRRVIRRAFAHMDGRHQIGAATEPQIQIGGLQAERGEIRLGIVGDESRDGRAREPLQRVGDVVGVGARRQGTDHAPKMIGRIAPEFDGDALGVVGQHNPVEVVLSGVHERGVAPFVGGTGNQLEPVGVGHEHAVHADDAQINLVAGRGPVAHLQLPALVARGDDERGLRVFKTEFRLGIFIFAQFRRADFGGREFLEGVEQRPDGGGLRGIGNGPGQNPAAVRAVGADFRRAGRKHLNARDGGGTQVGQKGRRAGDDRTEVVFKNEDEREQRRGNHEPDPVVLEFMKLGTFQHPTFNIQRPKKRHTSMNWMLDVEC